MVKNRKTPPEVAGFFVCNFDPRFDPHDLFETDKKGLKCEFSEK